MKHSQKLFSALSVLLVAAVSTVLLGSCAKEYETVKGDPYKARIYTLDNGLKVYMSVNKETPRIQTYIAVRTGGKNDPADNTGLAHYMEHIMFKGTEQFGTTDYEKEKVLLDQIQSLYDVYRTKTDPAERKAIYHRIDSISYEASKLAIPNEYDKMMALIGAQGSNAFTSDDVTCYTEDIPSNQIENWAKVQSDRFKHMVIRGFHTELEAVYEEYNRGLTNDTEKALDAIDAVLFKNHPYGTQTVIGTQNHLKNPDITAIKKQNATYYVPNNAAICVAGDFNPEEMLSIIKKYFGDWQPNENLPAFTFEKEEPITSPVELEVVGNDAEFTMLSWRAPGESSIESDISDMVSYILYNGTAGLVDLDIVQQQKLLMAQAFNYGLADYSEMLMMGMPIPGQDLKEVKDILLAEVEKLRSGDFDESLIKATINNLKLNQMQALERNSSIAMAFVNSFVNGNDWKVDALKMDRLAKVTKKDIVDWANKYLDPNACVIVYKRVGDDPSLKKIEAPAITPIVTNRDLQSDFLKDIQACVPAPIEPVFVDYSKDLTVGEVEGLELLYKHNDNNDIATLRFSSDFGTLNDPALKIAMDYIQYLGTPTRTPEQIASEMYSLACSMSFSAAPSSSTVGVRGLGENIPQALSIVEDLVYNAVADEEVLSSLKANELKARADSKLNQRACLSALNSYMMYGEKFIKDRTLSNEALLALSSEELLSKVRSLFAKDHKVLYYGPMSESKLKETVTAGHKVASDLEKVQKIRPAHVSTAAPKVFVAPYTSKQFNYTQFSNRGDKFDPALEPKVDLFNEYFGGGMNTIVFQEMRESRALAYSAGAMYLSPSFKDDNYVFYASIGSQNDKLVKAVNGFKEIIEDMPRSEAAFGIAKTSLISSMRTKRVRGWNVISSYLSDRELGLTESLDPVIFETAQTLTLDDLAATHEQCIKGRTYFYGILGEVGDLDMGFLKTMGEVKVLTLEEIFGY